MKKNPLSLSRFVSQSLCSALAVGIALSPVTSALAGVLDVSPTTIGKGDAAQTLPDVDSICAGLRLSLAGDFKRGEKAVKILSADCAGLSRNQRATKGDACYTTMQAATDKMDDKTKSDTINKICASSQVASSQDAQVFCALHTAASTSQAIPYCEAYDSAKGAETSVTIVAGLDVAAAGICWAEAWSTAKLADEYAKAKKAYDEKAAIYQKCKQTAAVNPAGAAVCQPPGVFTFVDPGASKGGVLNSGACGGAAMAAGIGELYQTVSVLTSGNHSAGNSTVDGDGNVSNKNGLMKNLGKISELAISGTGSYLGIKYGVCYYWPQNFPKMCSAQSADADSLDAANARQQQTVEANKMVDAASGDNTGAPVTGKYAAAANYVAAAKKSEEVWDKFTADSNLIKTAEYKRIIGRRELAKNAAWVFTGLAAMRAYTLYSIEDTKGSTKNLLQSLFKSQNGTVVTALSGTVSGSGNLFAATGTNFTTTPVGTITNAATAKDSPEAFLLPSGSPLLNSAANMASKIPTSKVAEAAAGGAAGMAGLVASAAGKSQAPADLQAAMATAFGKFAGSGSDGYGGSGGGRSMASKGGESPDLNLKGLFGGEKDQVSAAHEEMAFRDIASTDDIWHSKNPKGNNLFQIVSDKYGSVQKRNGL